MNIKKPRLRFAFFAFALAAVSALSGCDDADRNVAYRADDCRCDECNVFNNGANNVDAAVNVNNGGDGNVAFPFVTPELFDPSYGRPTPDFATLHLNGGFDAALYRVPVEEPLSQASGVFPPPQNWTVPTTTFSPYVVPAPIVQLPPQPSPVRLPRLCGGCDGIGDCSVCNGDGDSSQWGYGLGPTPCSACNASGRCFICNGSGTR